MDCDKSDGSAFFRHVGADAVIKNLILRDVCVNVNKKDCCAALFAMNLYGTITQCGAEGRIVVEMVDGVGANYAGYAGLVWEVYDGGTISECYAKVDMETERTKCAGLAVTNAGTIENSFAMGSVKYKSYANFGGVAVSTRKPLTNCYSAISVQLGGTPDVYASIGGVYGYSATDDANSCYFNRDLVQAAFEKVPVDVKPFDKGTGLVTSEMKGMSSFVDWDFENVWGRRADQNDGYPYLHWTAPGQDNDLDVVVAETITLDKTEVEDFQGATVQLTATVTPVDASNKNVLWSSSDPNVAVVDETGLVTLVGEGTAVITVALEANPDVTATCEVTVEVPNIMVASLTVDTDAITLKEKNETCQLHAWASPENATNRTLVWTSEDEAVAVVDQDGLVTAVGAGSVAIVVKTTDGSNLSARCLVTVEVTIEDENTGISDATINSDSEVVIVSLQGSVLYIGKWADAHLAPSIYVVRHSDGVTTKMRIR